MGPLSQRLHRLLRWSEKYTKTDMVYLAHGGFWLSLGTVATAASSFILSIAFANLLPQAVYGTYKYIISVASVFNAFTLTGLETAVVQAVSNGKEGVLKRAFWTNLGWSVPVALAATAGALYYFLHGNSTLGVSLLLIAFVQPLTVSMSLGAAFLNGKKEFKITAGYYAVDNFFPAGVLVCVMLLSHSALLVLLAYFLSNLAITTGMYWYVTRRFRPNDIEDPRAITYAKHLSAMDVFANIADNFDKILTFHFLGPVQLALYSFALALPSQAKLITKPLYNLMLPNFSQRSEEELRKTMGEKVFRFFLFGAMMTVGYILIAPFAFKLLYPQYYGAVFLSQIYALSFLAMAPVPMGVFLVAKSKVKAQYIQNIVTGIFQIVAAVAGMVWAGLLGLIIARVATRVLGQLFNVVFYYTEK